MLEIRNLSQKYEWTRHSQIKMRHYALSESRVKRVIRFPKRYEEGVLEGAVAVMQPTSIRRDKSGKENWGQEIWVMYTLSERASAKPKILNDGLGGKVIRIITAWRYPGASPKRNPIPEEVIREAQRLL